MENDDDDEPDDDSTEDGGTELIDDEIMLGWWTRRGRLCVEYMTEPAVRRVTTRSAWSRPLRSSTPYSLRTARADTGSHRGTQLGPLGSPRRSSLSARRRWPFAARAEAGSRGALAAGLLGRDRCVATWSLLRVDVHVVESFWPQRSREPVPPRPLPRRCGPVDPRQRKVGARAVPPGRC